MVLELQAKVVPFHEVHVGAHQVQQHLARGFLLWIENKKKQSQSILAGTPGFLTVSTPTVIIKSIKVALFGGNAFIQSRPSLGTSLWPHSLLISKPGITKDMISVPNQREKVYSCLTTRVLAKT